MSNYRKLEKHPLVLVLVEVKYSPILNLKKYIPELHDKLRHSFPHVITQIDKSIKISNNQMEIADTEKWTFKSKDSSSLIDIDSERVIFTTTDYDRFEGFQNSVKRIIEVISNILSPSYFSRIGLRYCDAIIPNDEDDLKKLVHPQLLLGNVYDDLGAKGFSKHETLIQTGETHLVVRAVQTCTTLVTPEDIDHAPLNFKRSEQATLRLILDFDHFWQDDVETCDFTPLLVLERLNSLHELSRKAFWSVTTDYARNKVWQ